MHHDLTGKQQNTGTMLIEMRDQGVRYDGRDLMKDNGPHEVPRWFGYELVSTQRAREVERPAPKEVPKVETPAPPAPTITHGDPVPSVGDPAPVNQDPQHQDPQPRGRRGRK